MTAAVSSRLAPLAVSAVIVSASLMSASALAQTAQAGKNLSALSPENLQKARAKAPFDLTGTWNMKIEAESGRHKFEPHPKLTPAAQAALDKLDSWAAKGYQYRDDSGACWPLGMPRMMTRFWPIEIIQLPTMLRMTTMFNNSARWIYLDGRGHPPDDELQYTYAGHSIGHWEGKTLVVDTVGMTDDHHWIQEGIPASTMLHVIERYTAVDNGNGFEVEFSMTDPENFEGTWKNTKRFVRKDRDDIEEHVCILEQMRNLPSFKYNIRE